MKNIQVLACKFRYHNFFEKNAVVLIHLTLEPGGGGGRVEWGGLGGGVSGRSEFRVRVVEWCGGG